MSKAVVGWMPSRNVQSFARAAHISTNYATIVRMNRRGKKSGCIWQPAQLYHVQIMMPMVLIALLHWFATFQTQTSSTMKSDSIFEGLVYSNFLPPLSNPSIGMAFSDIQV